MEWLKDLKKEELPENYQELLLILTPVVGDEVEALAVLLALATHYNKQAFYYSGIDAIIAHRKREWVIAHQGRKKVSEMARATGLSERSIYEIYEGLQKNKQRDMFNADLKKEERHEGGPAKSV